MIALKPLPVRDRILYLHAFSSHRCFLHIGNDVIKIALVGIQLIDEEDNRFVQFFRIAEIVLRSDFRSILAIRSDKNHSLVQTLSAVIAPPIKSSDPGQSMMLRYLLFHPHEIR